MRRIRLRTFPPDGVSPPTPSHAVDALKFKTESYDNHQNYLSIVSHVWNHGKSENQIHRTIMLTYPVSTCNEGLQLVPTRQNI